MNRFQLSLIFGFLLLFSTFGWYTSQSGSDTADATPETVRVLVEMRYRMLAPDTVTVAHHQEVILRLRSDESGEFHIGQYDHSFTVPKGQIAPFTFTADRQGRFPIHFHPKGFGHSHDHAEEKEGHTHDEIPVGSLIVMPR